MLFDLRGRGRRRTVQVIYVGLALLFGVGFIGFGVGVGGGGGGILNALTGESGAPKASFAGQVKKYQKLVVEQPKSLSAWEGLINAQLHEAGGESSISNGKLTSQGKELFSDVAQSWNSYLALNPPKPNPKLAKEMLRVFGEEGLNQPASEVAGAADRRRQRPQSAAYSAELAEFAYKAHNERQGDLAAEKAVSLAPASERREAEEGAGGTEEERREQHEHQHGHEHCKHERRGIVGIRDNRQLVERRICERHDHRRRQDLQSQPEGQGTARKQREKIADRFVAGAFCRNPLRRGHTFRIGRAGLESLAHPAPMAGALTGR